MAIKGLPEGVSLDDISAYAVGVIERRTINSQNAKVRALMPLEDQRLGLDSRCVAVNKNVPILVKSQIIMSNCYDGQDTYPQHIMRLYDEKARTDAHLFAKEKGIDDLTYGPYKENTIFLDGKCATPTECYPLYGTVSANIDYSDADKERVEDFNSTITFTSTVTGKSLVFGKNNPTYGGEDFRTLVRSVNADPQTIKDLEMLMKSAEAYNDIVMSNLPTRFDMQYQENKLVEAKANKSKIVSQVLSKNLELTTKNMYEIYNGDLGDT